MIEEEGLVVEADEIEASNPQTFKIMLEMYNKTRDPKYLDPHIYLSDKWEFYPHDPVSVERWLYDDDYFGFVGRSMWPAVRDEFFKIMEANPRPLRVILKGSIGWGKTFLSNTIMCRLLYELNCLRRPQAYYGLSPTSYISFMNLSVNAGHAYRVFFSNLLDMIDSSPWFARYAPRRKPSTAVLLFPKKLISFMPGSSSEMSALGENLFGGVIEEANFFPVVKNSAHLRNSIEDEYDLAKRLQDSVWRRMKSRYQRMGRLPGMLVLNSSANYPGDFLDRMSGQPDPTTMVIDHSEWDTKPPSRYTGNRFHVFVGDKYNPPRILKKDDDLEKFKQLGEVVSVPEEYAADFYVDLPGAIRDIVGKTVRASNKFIVDTSRLPDIIDPEIPIPFNERYLDGLPSSEFPSALKLFKLLNPVSLINKKPLLKMHPNAFRFAHVDLSAVKDSTGICVCHIGHLDEVRRHKEEGDGFVQVKEVVPVIYIDLLLRIKPEPGCEVQIDDIRDLFYDLNQKFGMRFLKITFDTWQSISIIQIMKKRFGEDVVGLLQAGSSKRGSHWYALKDAINEHRLHCYNYPPLMLEILGLEQNPRTQVVDHPRDGCLSANTRIPLLNGEAPKISELAGKHFFLYSVNPQGRIVVGFGHNAHPTGCKKVVDLLLDNGERVRCTEDHLFLTKTGAYVAAKDINPSISLFPLYLSEVQSGGWGGYLRLKQPLFRHQELLHLMVAKQFGLYKKGCSIHHIDEDYCNNDPTNLVTLSNSEHIRLHNLERQKDPEFVARFRGAQLKYAFSPEGRETARRLMRKLHENRRQAENHKVVDRVDCGVEEVWDITVDKHHNFAVSSGVFVHNSHDVAEACAGAVFNVMENFEMGIQDKSIKGLTYQTETLQERMAKESREWLMGVPKKEKPKENVRFNDDEWDIEKLEYSDLAKKIRREGKREVPFV